MMDDIQAPMATATEAAPTTTTATTSADWHFSTQRAVERIDNVRSRQADPAPSGRLASLFTGDGVLGSGKPAFRVGQLDTELLDEELLELLKGQLWGGLKYFRSSLKESFEPEFLLLLRAALFKLTIWDNNATYGAALQNLRYVDARRSGLVDVPPTRLQKGLYGLCTVGGRYLYSRLNLYLLSRSNTEDSTPFINKISKAIDSLSTVHSALTFLSFTAFLVTGHYRTLLDRVLRMRLISPSRVVSREVSFEYLNRQLVWHAFTEFLLFILPLVRVGRWRRWWARLMRKIKGAEEEGQGELSFLPEKTCAVCHKESDEIGGAGGAGKSNDIVNPYESVECGCVYCYVCLAGKVTLEEGQGWGCLRCGTLIKAYRPWRGGLKGLTGVGDWGEEVVEKRVGFKHHDDEDSDEDSGIQEELELADGERDDEDSVATQRGRLRGGHRRSAEWDGDERDDSVYNTAEGEDSEVIDDDDEEEEEDEGLWSGR
ncbi:peroxisome assembly protein (Peroxin-2) [Rhizina undulata]